MKRKVLLEIEKLALQLFWYFGKLDRQKMDFFCYTSYRLLMTKFLCNFFSDCVADTMTSHSTSGFRKTRNSNKMSLSPIGGNLSPVLSEVEHSPAHNRTFPEHQSSPSGPQPDHQVLTTILEQLQHIEQKMTGIENHATTLMSRINTLEDHIAHPPAPTASTPSAGSQPPQQTEAQRLHDSVR